MGAVDTKQKHPFHRRTDVTGVFGTPAIEEWRGSVKTRPDLGATRFFGAFAGFFGCLLCGFLDSLLCGFLDSLLRGFLYGFLSGLLGGFLRCFFRHSDSPENGGLKTKHKQNCSVPL